MLEKNLNFLHETSRQLQDCGYKHHGEGIFTKGEPGSIRDWLSISGNSFFYIVSAGVVFPDLSDAMRNAMPAQTGIEPFDGIDSSLIPFVHSPAGRYVELPSRGETPDASAPLTNVDAQALARCLCATLPAALSRFHDLEQAVMEVEATLQTGGAKAFLLILAYLRLGRSEDAVEFGEKTLCAFRSASTRAVYSKFLENVWLAYDRSTSATT